MISSKGLQWRHENCLAINALCWILHSVRLAHRHDRLLVHCLLNNHPSPCQTIFLALCILAQHDYDHKMYGQISLSMFSMGWYKLSMAKDTFAAFAHPCVSPEGWGLTPAGSRCHAQMIRFLLVGGLEPGGWGGVPHLPSTTNHFRGGSPLKLMATWDLVNHPFRSLEKAFPLYRNQVTTIWWEGGEWL